MATKKKKKTAGGRGRIPTTVGVQGKGKNAVPPQSPITGLVIVPNLDKAVRFYSAVFGAKEVERYQNPKDKKVWFATLTIDGAPLQFMEPFPDMALLAPPLHKSAAKGEGDSHMLSIHVQDVDKTFAKAVKQGATAIIKPYTAHWGARYAEFRDVAGQRVACCTNLADLTIAEKDKGFKELIVARGATTPKEVSPTLKSGGID